MSMEYGGIPTQLIGTSYRYFVILRTGLVKASFSRFCCNRNLFLLKALGISYDKQQKSNNYDGVT